MHIDCAIQKTYKLTSPFGLIHLTVFAAGPILELVRHALKEMSMSPRFESLIEVVLNPTTPSSSRFAAASDDLHICHVFTNHRCSNFEVYTHVVVNGSKVEVDRWLMQAEPGCIVMAEVEYYEPHPTLPAPTKLVKSGYAAFIFNATGWRPWQRSYDVQVYLDPITDGLQIAITGLRGMELVRVNSRGHRHELITFEHVLDYCAGMRSLADILALVEAEGRRRLYQERQMVYKRLLGMARKLKGAVRSKTAAEIEDILMELAGEKLPF